MLASRRISKNIYMSLLSVFFMDAELHLVVPPGKIITQLVFRHFVGFVFICFEAITFVIMGVIVSPVVIGVSLTPVIRAAMSFVDHLRSSVVKRDYEILCDYLGEINSKIISQFIVSVSSYRGSTSKPSSFKSIAALAGYKNIL